MDEPKPEIRYEYAVEQKVSANAFFDTDLDGEAVRLQITARHGATAEQIASVVEQLLGGMKRARVLHPKPDKPLPPPQEHPAQNGEKHYERRPVPESELPPDLPTGGAEGGPYEYFADDFEWITIEPQPDEKATVKFWKAGLEFPVGAPINKWKHKSVATMLQALGDIDPSKAQKIVVQGRQFWMQGNEYKGRDGSTKHYKDLKAVIKHL